MKLLSSLVLINLLVTTPLAQGQGFGEQQAVAVEAAYLSSAFSADLDGDGDLDILSASLVDNKIAWYENLGGGAFGMQQVITEWAEGAKSVYAADLDGDGDLDVLSASASDNKVAWYENLGDGTFGLQKVISTSMFSAQSVYAADLDGDGDMDVLSAGNGPGSLTTGSMWHENFGGGVFGPGLEIGKDRTLMVVASDLDGDGDSDVLLTTESAGIKWSENLGGGVFGPLKTVGTLSAPIAYAAYPGDIDGDGDEDVIATTSLGLMAHKNLGGGVFGPGVKISTSCFCRALRVVDLNNDGALDLVTVSNFNNPEVIWYENLGGGVFSPPLFLANSEPGVAASVLVDDLTGDGESDVVVAVQNGGLLSWHKNLGGEQFETQDPLVASPVFATSVFAVDLDGDSDSDVLVATGYGNGTVGTHFVSEVLWYENLGGGSFGNQIVITNSAIGAYDVFAADLDGDGDPDVLSASEGDDMVAWYENLGGGLFGPLQVITTSASGARSVFAIDLDNDGDTDVLSASPKDNKIAWYENLGGGTFGPQQVLTVSAPGANDVYAIDLDGDGDVDVLSASGTFGGMIAWYPNLGGGSFGAPRVITLAVEGAKAVFAADLDGDGDADVLSASATDNKLAWYENKGGGDFGPQQLIDPDAFKATSVHATDLDKDGHVDVLVGTHGDKRVSWYRNLGGGVFGPRQNIGADEDGIRSVFTSDLDGDGDEDVLSACWADHDVSWYENLTGSDCNSNGVLDVDDIALGNSLDCNGNGVPDECDLAANSLLDIDGDGHLDACIAPPLMAHSYEVSLTSGGIQRFDLLTPSSISPSSFYILLGSISGTTPGVAIGPLVFPLNPDAYLQKTFASPNLPPLTNSLSSMTPLTTGGGYATASFYLPPMSYPALVGLTVHHAFVTWDPQTFNLEFVSNAVPLILAP